MDETFLQNSGLQRYRISGLCGMKIETLEDHPYRSCILYTLIAGTSINYARTYPQRRGRDHMSNGAQWQRSIACHSRVDMPV